MEAKIHINHPSLLAFFIEMGNCSLEIPEAYLQTLDLSWTASIP